MRKRPRKTVAEKVRRVLRKYRILRIELEKSRYLRGEDGKMWQDAFCEVYDQLKEVAR